jgi:23S rRNA pseudouridine955/2504/2580 synthase
LGKKKRILRELHELLRAGQITKKYWALTQGQWREDELWVNLPLWRCHGWPNKHAVVVQQDAGKASLTLFRPQKVFKQATLVEARLYTGRTHQIRVHAQSQGHPIAGDDRYGNAAFNQLMRRFGLKRLFLHAQLVDFTLPSLRRRIRVEAPLDPELEAVIQAFAANDQKIN